MGDTFCLLSFLDLTHKVSYYFCFFLPVPLPEVIVPLYSGLFFGSGMSLKLILPVPRPDVTYFIPPFSALSLDAAWISLNCSPDHFDASLSTQMNPLPLPARILTLVILITYNTEILINKIFKMLQF